MLCYFFYSQSWLTNIYSNIFWVNISALLWVKLKTFSSSEADLRLLPETVWDKSFCLSLLLLIPVVTKRETFDWLSSISTLLWGALKISGHNVQIAVHWLRRESSLEKICQLTNVILSVFKNGHFYMLLLFRFFILYFETSDVSLKYKTNQH